MLYRTHHHPFLYTFNPFSHSSLSPHLLSSSSSNPPKGMEYSALSFADELLGVNGDDLFVDQLLDFSNDFSEGEEQPPPKHDEPEEEKVIKEEMKTTAPDESALVDEFGSLPESELTLQAEGLESLEWLSHFVEDSFSDYSLTGKLNPSPARPERDTSAKQQQPCFTTPVQTKARTKRARTGVRVWPVLSPESSTSSSSSTSSAASFAHLCPWPATGEPLTGKPPAKKQKKKLADGPVGQPRRCSHCGVTKTPQWRAGPLGSKTLCNACGVRYKSGRLLPEYRPACSPTFSTELHSNNHRKVLEMRRKKEPETETGAGLPTPVQSF